jgi:hypothetical protein
VVDDGIATGDTMRAVLQVVRQGGAARHPARRPPRACGGRAAARATRRPGGVPFYREFSEVSDGEVMALLGEARASSARLPTARAAAR